MKTGNNNSVNMEITHKHVFEVARELKVTTPEILEFLDRCGFSLPRRHMSPVTIEMYEAILFRFNRIRFNLYSVEKHLTNEQIEKIETTVSREIIPKTSPQERKTLDSIPEIEKQHGLIHREIKPVVVHHPRGTIYIPPRHEKTATPTVKPQLSPKQLQNGFGSPLELTPLDLELIRLLTGLNTEVKKTLLKKMAT